MTNFVGDLTDLPFPVTDLNPIPVGQDSTKWMDATKYNQVCQAAVDLRGWILTGLVAGTYTNVTAVVDANGRVTSITTGAGTGVPTSRTITATAPIRIDGGASADLSANRTLSLANTVVTPGSYTFSSITVGADGRITAASSGTLAAIATSGSATDLVAGAVPAARMPAMTGDVTSSAGSVALTVAAHAVKYNQLEQAIANSFVGNNTGSTADKIDMTVAQARTLLGLATVATSASAADLSAGTLLAARMPALTGDVTTSAGAVATTIAANAVTNAKAAQMATLTIKGNNTGGTANSLDLTVAQVLTMLGVTTPNAFDLGDGSDGAAVLDGTNTFTWATKSGSTYTMTRPFFVSSITVNSGSILKPDGWTGRCQGTFTNNGDVTVIGNAASGTTAGAATWTASSRELPAGSAGGTPPAAAGGASNSAPQVFDTTTVAGGTGGLGGGSPTAGGTGATGGIGHGGGGGGGGGSLGAGNGAAGGAGGSISSIEGGGAGRGDSRQYMPAITGRVATGSQFTAGSGGGSGSNASAGSGASAGGGGGGWMAFAANAFAGSGTWTISGGAGAAATGIGAGGGSGGGGGYAAFRAFSGTYPTATKAGGLGGAGSAGAGIISAGGAGGPGGVGYQVNL